MQRIHAHLPAAIKHLRWAYLSLIALITGLISTPAAHAAALPKNAPDLHTSRDGSVIRTAVRAVLFPARQHSDRALALHKVTAGESLSSVAAKACGHANDWTGIYTASRSRHLTARNANVLNTGQLLAIRCAYVPAALKYAEVSHPHITLTAAYVHHSGGKIWGVTYGYPNYCGDGDGDGYDVSCASIGRGGSGYQAVTVHSGHRYYRRSYASTTGTYHGSSSFEQCVIARESGGNSQVMNSSGHYGLYQFSESTWEAYGGSAASFGHASAATQRQVFDNAMAQGGQSNWSPYDGC